MVQLVDLLDVQLRNLTPGGKDSAARSLNKVRNSHMSRSHHSAFATRKGLGFERVGSNCATLFCLLLRFLCFFVLNSKLIYLFTSEHRLGRSGTASSNNSPRLTSSQQKKQTSVKFKMSVVNLLERLHLSRNMNTCSLIAFSFFFFFFLGDDFYFIAATDTDVPIEILVPVPLRWRGGRQ